MHAIVSMVGGEYYQAWGDFLYSNQTDVVWDTKSGTNLRLN